MFEKSISKPSCELLEIVATSITPLELTIFMESSQLALNESKEKFVNLLSIMTCYIDHYYY